MPARREKVDAAPLKAVLNAMPWPALVVRAEGTVVHSNAAYAAAFPGQEPAGLPLSSLQAPWNRPGLLEAAQQALADATDDIPQPRELGPAGVPGITLYAATLTPGLMLLSIDDRRTPGGAPAQVQALNQRLEQVLSQKTVQVHQQASQLRQLMSELLTAEDRERERVAIMLHDHLQQMLVAAQMRLHALDEEGTPEKAARAGHEARKLLQQAIDLSRSLAVELSPPLPPGSGLAAALRWLAQHFRAQHALSVAVRVQPPQAEAPPALQGFLLRALRELLFNVVKHAGVTDAEVSVEVSDSRLRLTVRDEGRGCEQAATQELLPTQGYGLAAIRQRTASMGGLFTFDAAPNGGCTVTVELPLPPAAG